MSSQQNIVGNVYDKYGTKNPLARLMMRGFLNSVTEFCHARPVSSVLEVGCGEGKLADHLMNSGLKPKRFVACDLELAQLAPNLHPAIEFRTASIYELPFGDREFDLVVCCEVLEHLEHPADGLRELARVAGQRIVLSTPREPLWRGLNLARGKYWRALGNTPGHIQHFSRHSLLQLVQSELALVEYRTPIPWTVILAEPLRNTGSAQSRVE